MGTVGRVAAEIVKNTPLAKEDDKAFFDAVAKVTGKGAGGAGGADTFERLALGNPITMKKFTPAKPQDMPGIIAPLGFFDPWGLSANVDQGKLIFFREAELKHGRLCMLATLGVFVSEKYHPMVGEFNVPAWNLGAITESPFQYFWLKLIAVVAIPELISMLGGGFYKPGE